MLELLKIRKDINWLIDQVRCLLRKKDLASPLSATEWSTNHDVSTGNPYIKDSFAWLDGNVYKSLIDNNVYPPTNSDYWDNLGEGHLLLEEQSDWDATTGRPFIKNKPTKTSDFSNDGEDGFQPFITLEDLPPVAPSILLALPFTTDHLSATNNQYVVEDIVWYLGDVYRCIANNDSLLPTDNLYWTNIGPGYPIVQQPIDWDSSSSNNQILNKPIIPTAAGLQEVTDIGATTTNAIKIGTGGDFTGTYNLLQQDGFENWFDGGFNWSSPITFQVKREQILNPNIYSILVVQSSFASLSAEDTDHGSNIGAFSTELVLLSYNVNDSSELRIFSDRIDLYKTTEAYSKRISLWLDYTTSNNNYYFPVNGGTLALTSDITAPALVFLDEGNGKGIVRTDRIPANFGNIGEEAFDISWSNLAGNYGATGTSSFAHGDFLLSQGYGTFLIGQLNVTGLNSVYTFQQGLYHNESGSCYANFFTGVGHSILGGAYCTVVGQFANEITNNIFNANDGNNTMFAVGNGTATGGGTLQSRSTAFQIYRNGRVIAPSLTTALITADVTGKILITKEWAVANLSGGGGTVTGVTATSPILSSGGTAPVISHSTADGNLHVPATNTTNNGKVLTAGATAGSLSWESLPIVVANTNSLFSIGLSGTASSTGSTATNSIFLGVNAGNLASNNSFCNYLGFSAGQNTTGVIHSNFFSNGAGSYTNASYANFFGNGAGTLATNATYSNFIGFNAGGSATNASRSNMFGQNAGLSASSANNSNLFGYNSGRTFTSNNIGSNNIIIGTNISLPNATTNAINLGGVLFGTNTYSNIVGDPSITPSTSGRIGIGVVSPSTKLHVYSDTVDTSGLRLERLTSSSATSTGQAIGVDANGNVVTILGGGGATNLAYTPSPTNGIVTSDTGTDATLPLVDSTNAGLVSPSLKSTWDGKQDALGFIPANDSTVVHLAGNETITGIKTFGTNIKLSVPYNSVPTIPGITADGKLEVLYTGTHPNQTEISYVKGVTSAIQTQINTKQDTLQNTVNIKSINGNSLLGSGDLTVSGSTPSQSAYTILANNTASSAVPTEQVYKDVAEQVYTPIPAWTATTAPTGGTNHTYQWSQIGKTVNVRLNLSYTSGGAGATIVICPFPTDLPIPISPSGLTTASANLYYGTGLMTNVNNSQPITLPTFTSIRRNATNTGYEFMMSRASNSPSFVYITIQYFTA